MQACIRQEGWARKLGGVVQQNIHPQTGLRCVYIREAKASARKSLLYLRVFLGELYIIALQLIGHCQVADRSILLFGLKDRIGFLIEV